MRGSRKVLWQKCSEISWLILTWKFLIMGQCKPPRISPLKMQENIIFQVLVSLTDKVESTLLRYSHWQPNKTFHLHDIIWYSYLRHLDDMIWIFFIEPSCKWYVSISSSTWTFKRNFRLVLILVRLILWEVLNEWNKRSWDEMAIAAVM